MKGMKRARMMVLRRGARRTWVRMRCFLLKKSELSRVKILGPVLCPM